MDKIQQSLEEVKQTTGKLKRLCHLEAELYKDSDVFSSQIKKNTNKIQRGQVNKWFDELDRFENEYKEQLTQLKELQTVANKNIEDAVASFEKIQEAYDTAKVSLNQTKVGSLQGLARDKINKKEIGCVGQGDENCIEKVREHFSKTSVRILGEKYLGNGLFGISFLDPLMGESYNSEVSTDCNCKVINVSIHVMR